MEQVYIKELNIEHVRHLENIRIPLSEDKMKHLILTGKNGSGKTSVLEALGHYLWKLCSDNTLKSYYGLLNLAKKNLSKAIKLNKPDNIVKEFEKQVANYETYIKNAECGLEIQCNVPLPTMFGQFADKKYGEKILSIRIMNYVQRVSVRVNIEVVRLYLFSINGQKNMNMNI